MVSETTIIPQEIKVDGVTIDKNGTGQLQIKDGVVNIEKIQRNVSYSEIGNTAITTTSSLLARPGLSYVKAKEFTITTENNTVINIGFGLYNQDTANTTYAQIYKNGSPVGVIRTTNSTSAQYYYETFTVNNGDVISVYWKSSTVNWDSHIVGFGLYGTEIIQDMLEADFITYATF